MILLDTNVLSELMRPQPNEAVINWVDAQNRAELVICTITVAEIRYGIARLPDGKRKNTYSAIASKLFDQLFAGRILSFDYPSAKIQAEILARRERTGQAMSMADAQIAAICLATATADSVPTLATRNIKDFTNIGLRLINPWQPEI